MFLVSSLKEKETFFYLLLFLILTINIAGPWSQVGKVQYERISFLNVNKNLMVAGKMRVDQETGNTHIYFMA